MGKIRSGKNSQPTVPISFFPPDYNAVGRSIGRSSVVGLIEASAIFTRGPYLLALRVKLKLKHSYSYSYSLITISTLSRNINTFCTYSVSTIIV